MKPRAKHIREAVATANNILSQYNNVMDCKNSLAFIHTVHNLKQHNSYKGYIVMCEYNDENFVRRRAMRGCVDKNLVIKEFIQIV